MNNSDSLDKILQLALSYEQQIQQRKQIQNAIEILNLTEQQLLKDRKEFDKYLQQQQK
ncbi:unnamed protein product [Paramecium sonneborni]|uniref:Uncharacterized protein n=1 Tax=Paramecium sonneborni TaxID=65129 RepID=A0A8S1QVB5_9CILI|nr:unnamed protein product [Paramecium sonneborni]